MSDYKTVAADVSITDRACLIKALEQIFGPVAENAPMRQAKFTTHSRESVDIVIRREQLPTELQNFGDIGMEMGADGQYTYLTCAQNDSSYFDRDKQAELVRQGMTPEQAKAAYPTGKFAADLLEYIKQVEVPYALFEFARDVKKKCPSAVFEPVQGVEGDDMAWMINSSVSASDLAALGISLPA